MSAEKQLIGKQREYLLMLQNVLRDQGMTYYPRFMQGTLSYQTRYGQFTAMLAEKNFSVDQIFSDIRFASSLGDLSDQADNRRATVLFQIHSDLNLPFNLYKSNKFDEFIGKIVKLKDENLLSQSVSDRINQWLVLELQMLELALGDEFSSIDIESMDSNDDRNSSVCRIEDEDVLTEGDKISNLLIVGYGLGMISTVLLPPASTFLFLSYSVSMTLFAVTAALSVLLMGYALYLGCCSVTAEPRRVEPGQVMPWTEQDWDSASDSDEDQENILRQLRV